MEHAPLFPVVAEYIKAIITNGGYAILFISTFLEGLPLIGMAVPGHVAILFGGFLAKIGTLNLYLVLILSSLGAILGDFLAFFLGRRFGISFIDRLKPFFFIRNEHLEKAQDLLMRHTGKAMIIGRFNPVTRALMPFLVGTNKTSHSKFWFFNVLGGISWVCISVGIGYVFGASYGYAVSFLGKFVVLAIILIALILWGYRFVNLRFHAFAKYEIFTLIINVISLLVFARTVQDALAPHSFLANFDVSVNLFVSEHVSQPVIFIAQWVSKIGDSEVFLVLGILIGIGLLVRKKWRRGALTIIGIVGSAGILSILKDYFIRARPDTAVEFITSFSFPSGHATMAAAFFVIVAYLVATSIRSWVKRELILVACVIAMFIVGFSRIILSVHWASDVIAGWALGTFVVTASILLVRYAAAIVKRKKN